MRVTVDLLNVMLLLAIFDCAYIHASYILCGSYRVHLALGLLSFLESSEIWVNKISLKAQTIESLTNLQDLNSSSKCEAAVLKARYQGGNDIEQRSRHDKSIELLWQSKERFKPPFAWDPQIGTSNSRQFLTYLMKVNLEFDRELVVVIILLSRCHLSVVSPVKRSSSSQTESSVESPCVKWVRVMNKHA